MRTPETTLDTRFSDPDAVATSWEETRRVLERADLFWISTVRADGRPHVTPLVAVWLEDAIHFATGPQEQKAVNIRTNRHVILTTGCNQWEEGSTSSSRVRRPDHGRGSTQAPRRGVGDEVGRTLALRSARPRLSARRWYWRGFGVLDHTHEGPRFCQGHVRPDAAPLLSSAGRDTQPIHDSQTAACISALIVTSA